jgi:hypothetical protein
LTKKKKHPISSFMHFLFFLAVSYSNWLSQLSFKSERFFDLMTVSQVWDVELFLDFIWCTSV